MKKYLFLILIIFNLFSCKSIEEKELRKIHTSTEGNWEIVSNNFNFDTQKINDLIYFGSCKDFYYKNSIPQQSCQGNKYTNNGIEFSFYYGYETETDLYILLPQVDKKDEIANIIYGKWSLTIKNNELIGKKIFDFLGDKTIYEFKAIKK